MAIFMLFDHDNTHPDPFKDEAGCYKRGDIVAVYEDDEPVIIPPAPPFVFLRLTGLSKAQADRFTESEVDTTDPLDTFVVRRRRYGIPWNLVPNQVKNALQNQRYYSTSWAAARQYIRNKRTGQGS